MKRPLYDLAAGQLTHRAPQGHAGLWFDKFCDTWRIDNSVWTMKGTSDKDNPKLQWIKDVCGSPVGKPEQIKEYAWRLVRLVNRRGGCIEAFKTESRFVTGLGHSQPVENGLAWHPTLGTPFLPGSSIKGLVRAWAAAELGPDKGSLERLFGYRDSVGSLCFLDAVPTAPVQLEADIMTPHQAGWNKKDPPGDWRSPTPIPFLVTANQTPFLFGIVPRRAVEADGDLDTVSGWLRFALEWWGGGAKTAVGYGRFHHDGEQTRRWTQRLGDQNRRRREERAHKEAIKTPEGRWRLKLEGQSEAEVLDLVRVHLEKEPLTDPVERRAFADAVLSSYPDWVASWRRGNKQNQQTSLGKKKLRERARLLAGTAQIESPLHEDTEQPTARRQPKG